MSVIANKRGLSSMQFLQDSNGLEQGHHKGFACKTF